MSWMCCNPYGSHDSEQTRKSRKIDEMLAKDKRQFRKQVKLLLLGAGESGKSTFLKQMKIIHGQSLIDDTNTVEEYKEIIYSNIIKGMKVLIDARCKLCIDWGTDDSIAHAHHVFSIDNKVRISGHLFRQYVQSIRQLWSDSGIQSAFARRVEFQLSDGVRYLFENIQRIGAEDYTPTNQDILHSRKATKSITEYCVTINKIPFRFVDVGGQRSQRQKWFQCFESVTSILFIVSSSEYDQVLLEDSTKNRLRESQNIFETIVNNRCFTEVSYILFLNKTDLLEEKLKLVKMLAKNLILESNRTSVVSSKKTTLLDNCSDTDLSYANNRPQLQVTDADGNDQTVVANNQTSVANNQRQRIITSDVMISDDSRKSYKLEAELRLHSIGEYFAEFRGDPSDLATVQAFILQLFDSVRRDKRKQMYHHFTTAVDTENIKYVFNAVRNTILQNNITQLMLQ